MSPDGRDSRRPGQAHPGPPRPKGVPRSRPGEPVRSVRQRVRDERSRREGRPRYEVKQHEVKKRRRLTRGDPGRRLGITFLCIIFVLSLFAGRLVQLQGMESGYYRRLAISERTVPISLPAVRGRILAADGHVLALTVDTYTVVADPPQIPAVQWQQVENTLASDLRMPIATVDNSLRHPTSPQYTKVAVQVPAAAGDQIQQQIDNGQLPGISLEQTYARTYPDGQYAANLVGFTSTVNGNLTRSEEHTSELQSR